MSFGTSNHFSLPGLAAAAALALLGAPAAAIAQSVPASDPGASIRTQTDAPSTTTLSVVAQAEELHDVAMDVTALAGSQLAMRQEAGFTDFAAQTPGFAVTQITPGWNREILRGENSGGTGATVATLIDDAPLSFSGSDNDAAKTSTNLDTYDLRRVEVLEGPQGTLSGAAAEGGVVRYVTNPPDLHSFHAGVEGGVSSVDHGQEGGSLKGYLNLPLWQDKAALRITGFDEDIPGYIDDPLLRRSDINQARKFGWRVSLLARPASDLSIRLGVLRQDLHAYGDNEVNVVGAALYPSSPAPANPFALVNGYSEDRYFLPTTKDVIAESSADIEYDLHWAKLASISSYGAVRDFFINDLTSAETAPGVTEGAAVGRAYGQSVAVRQRQLEALDKWNQEFRLASEPSLQLFGRSLDWLVGAFATREDVTFDQFYDVYALPASGPPNVRLTSPAAGGAYLPSRYEQWAVYGQIDYHFTPSLDLAAGARTSSDREMLHQTLECCVFDGPTTTLPLVKSNESSTTWSVSPRWKITSDAMVYARIATGYRPGGPNLIVPGAPADYPYVYHSDSTTNYELGLRTALLNHSVNIDLTAYYVDWSQIQIGVLFVSPDNGRTYKVTGNAGEAISQGLEWNLSWEPLHGLTFGLVGAYTDAHLTQNAPGLGARAGDELSYVPTWSNTLNADYQWDAFADYRGFVGGTWTFTGSRYTDFSSSALGDPHVKLPPYGALGLHAGVENERYTFELYGKNLTGSRGIAYYSGYLGYGETGLATLTTPRTIGLRVAAEL